jgi:hypothetical protein
VGNRADQLKSEIDQTRRELDDDLAKLKTEAKGLQRKVLLGAGVAVAVLIGVRIVRGLLGRSGDD